MAKMRKVKRSIATAILVWIGRRLLSRVQRHSLRSVSAPRRSRFGRTPVAVATPSRFAWRTAKPAPVTKPRRRAGKGIAIALLSAAAVAALKVGVDHVVANEREQHVVTPDFDVFADDDE